MELVLGFGELAGAALLLTAAITGGKLSDVISGRAYANWKAGGGTAQTAGAATAPAVSTTTVPASTNTGGTVIGDVTYGDLNAIAKLHNWSASEVQAWAALIPLESNGTITDTNSSSGAYGIAQGITGPSWYAAHGGNATTVMGQLTAMANYIASRYGTPAKAFWFHTTPVSQGGSISASNPSGWY